MKNLIAYLLIFGLISFSNLAFGQDEEQDTTESLEDTSSAIIIDSATEIMNTGQFVEEEEIEEIVEESQ